MMKQKTAFVCNDCGADYRKWQGQCAECKAWNPLSELHLGMSESKRLSRLSGFAGTSGNEIRALSAIDLHEIPRIVTGMSELDLVLGGGLVSGSCILVGGEPGAGKSTLLLQALCKISQAQSALYVTGE